MVKKATSTDTAAPDDADVPDALPVVPEELQFTSDAEQTEGAPVTFTIDGEQLTALQPTLGTVYLLSGSFSENASDLDRINAIFGFFNAVLNSESKAWMNRYIRSRTFDENVLMDVIVQLSKHWNVEDFLPANKTTGNRAARRATRK